MLSVFGDESHDETNSRVFAVGGLLGSSRDWESFREKWGERLGGTVFHAADCEAGYGDFRGMGEAERKQLHRDLTRILADSKLMGYGSAIDLAGCREAAPSSIARFPDIPYYDCFIKTVKYLSDLAAHFIPRERVEFTFDQHKSTEYNAGLLYAWIAQYVTDMSEKVSFCTRREPGIQAADLWARELMKRYDAHLHNRYINPRPQWLTLVGTKRFRYKFTLKGDMVGQFKEAESRADGLEEEYEAWRTKNALVDNLSNRFRHAAMRDWSKDEKDN
jgi:hypothetical protein